MTVDNVAPSIAISGAATVNEGSAYSLTLGAVTDPGTDTVTSYVVHWGDGNSDTYGSNGAEEPHLRRRPGLAVDHRRPGRRGRNVPRSRECQVGTRRQRRSVDRDQRRSVRQRGLGLQPDPGRGHRSGHGHRLQLDRSLGRRPERHLRLERRQEPHLCRRPGHAADHRRPRRRGRNIPRSREPEVGNGRQRRPDGDRRGQPVRDRNRVAQLHPGLVHRSRRKRQPVGGRRGLGRRHSPHDIPDGHAGLAGLPEPHLRGHGQLHRLGQGDGQGRPVRHQDLPGVGFPRS